LPAASLFLSGKSEEQDFFLVWPNEIKKWKYNTSIK
jgi:hypothetical protein